MDKFFIFLCVIYFGLCVSLGVGILFVAGHFISKFW